MIFKTPDMEGAILLLAKHYKRVLVRVVYNNYPALRLRIRRLAELHPYIATRGFASDGQIELWNSRGGVLVSYRQRFPLLTQDAHVFCECPLQRDDLRDANALVVVYTPPSWRWHYGTIKFLHPTAETARLLYNEIAAAGISKEYAAICEAVGMDARGMSAIGDAELCARFGFANVYHLNRVRRKVFYLASKQRFAVWPMIPRIEPEHKALLPMYRAIQNLPQLHGMRLAVNRELRAVGATWKVQIKDLAHCGSIKLFDRVGFYRMGAVHPDYDLIQDAHEAATERLDGVIAYVEAAPELTAAGLAALRRARPPVTVQSTNALEPLLI